MNENLKSWIMLLSCRGGGGGGGLKCMYVFRRLGHMMIIPSFSSDTATATTATTTTTEQDLNLKLNTHQSSNVFSISSSKVVYDSNIKISSLGRSRKVEEARYLFDKMPQRDIVSYASMITVYLKNGDLSNAENLFHSLPSSSSGSASTSSSSSSSNVVVSSAMIDAYAKASRMEDARRIFDHMPHTNVFTWTSLISGYLRIGQTDEAHRLFDRMPIKNVVSWTTMVLGYARNGLITESRQFFDRMPEKNVIAWTTIVKAYVENNQIDQAKKLFDEMPFRNLYSWNIMITGYLDQKRVTEAIELFRLMPQRNAVSWTTMVTGLARNGMTKHARDYFDQIPKKDIAAWNAMITAYASDGLMIEATELFNSMPERNTVTWNAMIDGYSRNGPVGEALNHLILMLRQGYRPNETSVTSVVAACESMLELMQVHALALMLGFESETSLSNACITMYSRSGNIGAAKNIFEKLEFKDIVSWTAMILAYSNHGNGAYALQVFARMLRAGAKPDPITFVGVLSGCSHAGLLQKGKMLFDSMSRAYSLEPKAEHYSCLVDLLGRAGHINEAMKVVNQMPPSERDGAVLGSLLGACKLYGDVVGVADQIGEDWIELEPTSSGGYVLLANLYAARGKWDDFARLRKKMKERKVKKVPGFSQIEVKNMSYVFFVGDRSHPRVKEIYAVLKEMLLPQMMEMGYTHEDPSSVVSG